MTTDIRLHCGLVALIDDADAELVQRFAWHATRRAQSWYVVNSTYSAERIRGSQYLHALLTGYSRTDHANGDGLDNRRSNLRPATRAQNMHNMRAHRAGTSRFKGVSWNKQRGLWRASMGFDARQYHLGYFSDETAAARAYDAKARDLFGAYAALNFPADGEQSALARGSV